MNKKTKNKNLTKLIVQLLTENYDLRDDWMTTIRMIHDKEMVFIDPKQLKMFSNE
jgi:hypothetical protein